MKKKAEQTIQTTYSDALYWSMSPMSKDKKYHLTRLNESILRKLIHYDKKDKRITYSNEWISKHVFLDITQIEKAIPLIEKKGFIKCITFSTRNEKGMMIKRRIININWDFIKEILIEVPKLKFIEKENYGAEEISNEVDEEIEVAHYDIVEKVAIEIETEITSTNSDFDLLEYLTKRKMEFAENELSGGYNFEILFTMNKEEIEKYFYQNENVWYIKTIANNNEDLWENIHGVNLRYTGIGSRLNLFTIDKNDKETDSFQLNWGDFNNYLDSKRIKFGDITLDDYETLKQFEKNPLNI
jgi:hypothetical protein